MSYFTKIMSAALISYISTVVANAQSITVYNQAYTESFNTDTFSDIIANAQNAYILIDPNDEAASKNINDIKAQNNQIAAYISIGTGEVWRADYPKMKPYLVNQDWDEWPGEFFISSTEPALVALMHARIDEIATLGYEWVEFDNMDWAFDEDLRKKYDFKTTEQQSIIYFQQMCDYVHAKDMKCMAKNMLEHTQDFDGVTFESYYENKNWWDIDAAQAFLKTEKLFIIVHYGSLKCDEAFAEYKAIYNKNISFICEHIGQERYIHYTP